MADPERFDADADPTFQDDADPDPWKIFWIWIRQNDADPLDPDPHSATLP